MIPCGYLEDILTIPHEEAVTAKDPLQQPEKRSPCSSPCNSYIPSPSVGQRFAHTPGVSCGSTSISSSANVRVTQALEVVDIRHSAREPENVQDKGVSQDVEVGGIVVRWKRHRPGGFCSASTRCGGLGSSVGTGDMSSRLLYRRRGLRQRSHP